MESPIKLFISHAHKDQRVAELLVEYLSGEYELGKREIRCTSVPDTDLSLGKPIAEQLRKDVARPIGFIGLLSHFGLDSVWVKFELGAAWVTQQTMLPILGPKVEETDPRLGPIGFIPLLSIEDEQCAQKLETYIRRMVGGLQIRRKEGVDNSDKLKRFIRDYRQFGGKNAIFSATRVRIISPESGTIVNRVITLKMHLAGVPKDGYIWIGVLNTQSNQIWPKESLEDSHTEGERSVEINENGAPEPGTLAFIVIGVGPAGNEMFKDWRKRAEKTGNWAGIPAGDMSGYGYNELARVDQLTLLKPF